MFNVNNRNTRTRCEICSKLTTKIPERRHGVVWTYFTPCSSDSIVNFERVNAGWDRYMRHFILDLKNIQALNKQKTRYYYTIIQKNLIWILHCSSWMFFYYVTGEINRLYWNNYWFLSFVYLENFFFFPKCCPIELKEKEIERKCSWP